MKLEDFLLNAYNDVAIVNARRETEVYIKYDINPAKYLSTDILNREIKAIKAGDGEFRVLLEGGDDDWFLVI